MNYDSTSRVAKFEKVSRTLGLFRNVLILGACGIITSDFLRMQTSAKEVMGVVLSLILIIIWKSKKN